MEIEFRLTKDDESTLGIRIGDMDKTQLECAIDEAVRSLKRELGLIRPLSDVLDELRQLKEKFDAVTA